MSELPMSAEERLAALERKVAMMWNGVGDLLGTEGYLQIGNSSTPGAVRLDGKSVQIASGDTSTDYGAIAFVPSMQVEPLGDNLTSNPPKAYITGRANTSGFTRIRMGALDTDPPSADLAFASVTVETPGTSHRGTVTLAVILDAVPSEFSTATLRHIAGTDAGVFELLGAFLQFDAATKPLGDPANATEGAIWYNNTDNQFKFYEGSTIKTLGGGGMTVKVKEADETVTSSTTLQNDDELWFAVAANEVWQFEGSMFIDTISSADFRFAVTGPSGAVGRVFAAYSDTAAFDAHVGAGDLGDTIDLQTTNTGTLVRFWGGIHNGANAGNLQVQWAQRVSQGTATTVHAGSYIKYIQANV